MENFFRENPDLCRTFVKASIEGWLYAFAHEDETLDMVMKYANKANLPTNRVHTALDVAPNEGYYSSTRCLCSNGILPGKRL